MPTKLYKHLFISKPTDTQRFSSTSAGGSSPDVPTRNRPTHADYLKRKLEAAWSSNTSSLSVSHSTRKGIYLDFIGEPGFDLMFKSLERQASGIKLLNVRKADTPTGVVTRATVFIPNDKRSLVAKKIDDYKTKDDKRSGNARNMNLVNGIADIQRSLLNSFWQDDIALIPESNLTWIECWLNSADLSIIERFKRACTLLKIEIGKRKLDFPERTVVLIRANRNNLTDLLNISDDVAEFRYAKQTSDFFVELDNEYQSSFVHALLQRISLAESSNNIAVLLLDSGVNFGHPLLENILSQQDCHTVEPAWEIHDNRGHGTLMAGVAAYGDLGAILDSDELITMTHRLESAKILPPHPAVNKPELWGALTSQGVSYAELGASHRKRIICMAVTSIDNLDRGRPSSWSAAIDQICSNEDNKRLFIISAGNVNDSKDWELYPDSNLSASVHDPAQSWNALTVGAFTNKVTVTNEWPGYEALAEKGGLSPYSTTSWVWDKKWPIKPEVLFEGGNVAAHAHGTNGVMALDELSILSTSNDIAKSHFRVHSMTSAACAEAARTAAKIQNMYPDAWPETIRGLLVHSAKWTEAQKNAFLSNPQYAKKKDYVKLLRSCGYGVCNINRALYCASHTLTLISQAELQPYEERIKVKDGKSRKSYVTRDMNLYNLPWPSEELLKLGEQEVKMRVTLSYYIEPSPSELGWKNRYRYGSHGLRFKMKRPTESEDDFIQRVNRLAREQEEEEEGYIKPSVQSASADDRWLLGELRDVGSIHSDIWTGTAAELANCSSIIIHPTIGWWRERRSENKLQNKARYSLLISLSVPLNTVDIYAPVATKIGISNPTPILIV